MRTMATNAASMLRDSIRGILPTCILAVTLPAGGSLMAVGVGLVPTGAEDSPGLRAWACAAALAITHTGVPAGMIATCWRELDARDWILLGISVITVALGAGVVGTADRFWQGDNTGAATVLLGMGVVLAGSLPAAVVYCTNAGYDTPADRPGAGPPRPNDVRMPEPPTRQTRGGKK